MKREIIIRGYKGEKEEQLKPLELWLEKTYKGVVLRAELPGLASNWLLRFTPLDNGEVEVMRATLNINYQKVFGCSYPSPAWSTPFPQD
jgi:hypothetical protein